MQTDGFQLNAFQQDGGVSAVFTLTPTAAVGLSGVVGVAGALALSLALSGSVAVNGTVSVTGNTAYTIPFSLTPTAALALSGTLALPAGSAFTFGTARPEVSGGYFPHIPRKTPEEVRKQRKALGITTEKEEPTPIEKAIQIPRRTIPELVRMHVKGEISQIDLEAEIMALRTRKKRQAEEEMLLLM